MPKNKSTDTLNFEEAMAEIESIVEKMESDEASLEDSLVAYKRGVELIQHCKKKLEVAQQQVKILEEANLKDFDQFDDK